MIRHLTLLLTCALLLASCANIPEQTAAQVIPNSAAQPQREPQLPAKDTDPITFVRRFIEASGDTRVAEAYLTEQARKAWRPDSTPAIIDDNFSTVPPPVAVAKETDPNVTSVEVKGVKRGWLDSYRSFVAQDGEYSGTVKLVKVDGQWRISDVPGNGLIIPIEQFRTHYRPVKLYFYDTSRSVLVPDLRYLPGTPLAAETDVVALLLGGPATGLRGATSTALPPSAIQRYNVTQAKDGAATVVNLAQLGELTIEDKQAIAVQMVLSLQDVAVTTVRLQVEGLPLLPDREDWKVADVLSASDRTAPKAQLTGMMVAGGRVRDLRDGKPIANPAGEGAYNVVSAAQSVDGSRLAVVERLPAGQLQLRIGSLAEGLRPTIVATREMTRPTWKFGVATDEIGNEVWTVADDVVTRLVHNREGTWQALPVNQAELDNLGKITELRLSRDGVRVAVVAGGKLYAGSVARSETGVAISAVKPLLSGVTNVVGVDWLDPSTLAVATNTATGLVWRVPVDGFEALRYNVNNLTPPLTAVTAAPSRQIVVTDAIGMWTVADIGRVWLQHPQNAGKDARTFYPG